MILAMLPTDLAQRGLAEALTGTSKRPRMLMPLSEDDAALSSDAINVSHGPTCSGCREGGPGMRLAPA